MSSRKEEPKRCPHCDASMNQHPHKLNIGLCKALYYCAKTYGRNPFKVNDLPSKIVYCNFASLRYWGLIEPHNETGNRKKGVWKVTPRGIGFCKLKNRLPEKLWSYRGKRVPDSWKGEKYVMITQVGKGYDYRVDYEESARGHNGIE